METPPLLSSLCSISCSGLPSFPAAELFSSSPGSGCHVDLCSGPFGTIAAAFPGTHPGACWPSTSRENRENHCLAVYSPVMQIFLQTVAGCVFILSFLSPLDQLLLTHVALHHRHSRNVCDTDVSLINDIGRLLTSFTGNPRLPTPPPPIPRSAPLHLIWSHLLTVCLSGVFFLSLLFLLLFIYFCQHSHNLSNLDDDRTGDWGKWGEEWEEK